MVDTRAEPGGVCLHEGCIPSKALLHLAQLIEEGRRAKAWGIEFGEPRVDIERVRAWKAEIVASMTGGLAGLCRTRNVEYLQGRARFVDARCVAVESAGGDTLSVAFDQAVIAVGSRPATLEELPADSPWVMGAREALELKDVPQRLLVVGGGYIGLELSTVYAALGSRVTIAEATGSLLPGIDGDLLRPLARAIERRAEAVRCDTRVLGLRERDGAAQVTLRSGGGEEDTLAFDRVLVAVGRGPDTRGLGLESTAVQRDADGFIAVGADRRTHAPTIFAVGDVAGGPMLAHKATHEGIVAAEAAAGRKVSYEPTAVPAVVYTNPEVAWCGLSETQAKAQGRAVRVLRFPWQASGRAVTLDAKDGVSKWIADAESGRLLGAGIVGMGAGELIAEAALALEMGAAAEDLAATIHPHPTLSESLMEAAALFDDRCIHLGRRRR